VLGLIAGWFGIDQHAILKGLTARFAKKGEKLVEANERAFAAGLEFAQANPMAQPRTIDPVAEAGKRMLVDGNEMCAAAAIFAGCDFFGGYPITPSTEIMQFLSREIWGYGGVVLQCEDEIASIGAALGASFGGKKAMTATSGPDMSLKTEIMGLATIAELPLVIVNVQRGGPSTGMPTKAEQSDLFQAVFSAHGNPTSSGRMHALMTEKRIRKFEPLCKRDDLFDIEGELTAPLALIAWGSNAGVCREALRRATQQGLNVKLLVPRFLFPINEGLYRRFFATVEAGLVVETSYMGQLYRVLRMFIDMPAGVGSFARPGGNPVRASEIVAALKELAMRVRRQLN
jgi:pyruvate/2-oxoacid:ferredoxin oxidoreductase alpha subunit